MPTHHRTDEERALDALSKRDRTLVREALPKRFAGEKITKDEERALAKYDDAFEDVLRWRFYSSIPIDHYRKLAGSRHLRTIRNHAARFTLPVQGTTVDLAVFLSTLHDQISAEIANPPKTAQTNGNGELDEKGKETRVKRQLAEVKLAAAKRDLIPRDEVRSGLRKLARRLRDLGDDLQRQCGSEAYELLDDALVEFSREITQAFGREKKGKA